LIVLGAGIQGTCAALVAAQSNRQVCLIEQDEGCLLRTSLRGEGKIHLGYVYAHDTSFKTAELLLKAAMSFAPLLDSWLPGQFDWRVLRSNPFLYVVARDTLVPTDQLFSHYARLEVRCRELQAEDARLNYLGEALDSLWKVQELPAWLNADRVTATVWTPETAIDRVPLRRILGEAVAQDPRIELLYGHVVEEVARKSHGFAVTGRTRAGHPWRRDAGCVVNALWDGRLAIDAQLGLRPSRTWVYRFKHRVLARTPPALVGLPSMTVVLGPYGDMVTRPHDDEIYLSWYPVCQTGWSQDLVPPAAWHAAATGTLEPSEQAPIIRDTLAAFDEMVPGLGTAKGTTSDGGVIFAWGNSNIDDEKSELHQRHEIGVLSADGYFSINTGKLTCAPYFAQQLGELLA
jgi:hypothetical protein